MSFANIFLKRQKYFIIIFSREKRKQEEAAKEQPASPKRKRLTPSPSPHSSASSVSGGDSDTEKPLSAFYQSLLESSYAVDGKDFFKLFKKFAIISAFSRLQAAQREGNDAKSTDELNKRDHQGEEEPKQHRRRVRFAVKLARFIHSFLFYCKKLRKIPK